jgi:hypothetical protein
MNVGALLVLKPPRGTPRSRFADRLLAGMLECPDEEGGFHRYTILGVCSSRPFVSSICHAARREVYR